MSDTTPSLILASRSPRRRQLLTAAGYRFEVVEPSESAEDEARDGESPSKLVVRLAYQKASDVVERMDLEEGEVEPRVVLGCDTVAECEGHVLGKPADEADARAMLQRLSGREHRVLSGLCLWPIPDGEPQVHVAETTLRMDPLSEEQLNEYLASGGWQGKAGAFGYQDRLGWVHVTEGSETNVVGLPMELLEEMLG